MTALCCCAMMPGIVQAEDSSDTAAEIVSAIGSNVDDNGQVDGNAVANSLANQAVASGVNSTLHGEHAPDWMKRTNIEFNFQKDWKPLYAIETIQPLGRFDDQSNKVFFTQGRISNASDLGTTANLGLGYRWLSHDESSMYGVNLFYDHAFKEQHARIGAGLEYFTGLNEFRVNGYKGVSGEKEVDSINHIFEKVVDGYDVEYATSFKNAQWVKAYINGYHWDYKHNDDVNGFKLGTEMQVTPQISLDMGYNKASGSDGELYAKVMYNLADVDTASWFGGKEDKKDKEDIQKNNQAAQSMHSKMLEKVRRQNNIVVERYQKDVNGQNGVPGQLDITIRM